MPVSGWRGSRRVGEPGKFQRRMHFAGAWYPAGEDACERAIRAFEAEMPGVSPGADGEDTTSPPLRWGVVPHAGWVYSGRLAARVFRALPTETPGESPVDLVIVLGGHLRPEDPVLAMTEGSWETPFGNLRIHQGFRADLENLPRVLPENAAAMIDCQSWQWPSIFSWLVEAGNVELNEMYRTFNCGVGLVLIVDAWVVPVTIPASASPNTAPIGF